MKSFSAISEQLERIYKLYYGYNVGSDYMLQRAERFMCRIVNVGAQF